MACLCVFSGHPATFWSTEPACSRQGEWLSGQAASQFMPQACVGALAAGARVPGSTQSGLSAQGFLRRNSDQACSSGECMGNRSPREMVSRKRAGMLSVRPGSCTNPLAEDYPKNTGELIGEQQRKRVAKERQETGYETLSKFSDRGIGLYGVALHAREAVAVSRRTGIIQRGVMRRKHAWSRCPDHSSYVSERGGNPHVTAGLDRVLVVGRLRLRAHVDEIHQEMLMRLDLLDV